MFSLLIAGCASLTPPPGSDAPLPGSTRAYQEQIALSGRLSVRYQNNGKDEALHGNFVWTQNMAQTSVTLLSPLGQTVAQIDVSPNGASLKQGNEPPRTAADVDALVQGTLGWPLPIAGLRDWLQGFAIEAAGMRVIASPQSPDVITRDGWRIHYASWQNETPAPSRPRRIDLERQTAQAGDVAIRIVIDSWQ
ncbi:lipoprotein insertase outer membrane protein LolB [Noviherbaspirillum cavernae]|uniref:lipoprotein insertase outer membrane protein LolB n=1 Tax=Noviherbaspirillum cavernae TaxID=2320862 RepID=UPI001F5B3176|nr:lipoprotein insertase outer membrane protein LolB [Noviherbaspirillum cavernae]